MLHKFEYYVELKVGFTPVLATAEETELTFVIEAKNRVTADRMVRAMLQGNDNIIHWSGICID